MLYTGPASAEPIQYNNTSATSAKLSWNANVDGVDQFHVFYTIAGEPDTRDLGYFPQYIDEIEVDNLRPSQPNVDRVLMVTVESISGSGSQKTKTSSTEIFIIGKLYKNILLLETKTL